MSVSKEHDCRLCGVIVTHDIQDINDHLLEAHETNIWSYYGEYIKSENASELPNHLHKASPSTYAPVQKNSLAALNKRVNKWCNKITYTCR